MTGLCDQLVEATLAASEVILDIYEAGFVVEIKGDETPVTKADREAEAIILAHLAAAAPDIPVVAEEAAAAGHIPDVNGVFFLVDPLDGTKEFIARNGEFTVNIALIRDNVPALGVIFTPAKGWLFVGEVGKGAWRGEVADPRVSHTVTNRRDICVRKPGEQVDVVGSRSHNSLETDDYLQGFPVREKKSIGSSLKFCLLASGEADLYPRFSRTMEWDTAAGDAILSAAGGTVTRTCGERLTYGKCTQDDAPFANPYFIAKTS
ncbi:3'(2'), 5'-bisphosphate nucleotidase [Cohaesibacter sp. ES.047]|uniref:3'(2'),5'-bisphosphate nucleotidase CysQ n=1 Tax=Cohaesibacter sp. ES.047 TaxID=1798205 RepID=UPI000BB8B424|nr:3'(2'),5'-bisphosphate nucleotidase CysQ [Cohaesibacter sp. ES.047]SNY90101.1 3'(2'), 5'-bisphosphate nucleotidase [Cohaesibacter sp. ES.047]